MADIQPQETVAIPTPVGPLRYVKVKLLRDLFKDGKTHKAPKEMTLELFSAENFEKAGDVKILKEVKK